MLLHIGCNETHSLTLFDITWISLSSMALVTTVIEVFIIDIKFMKAKACVLNGAMGKVATHSIIIMMYMNLNAIINSA